MPCGTFFHYSTRRFSSPPARGWGAARSTRASILCRFIHPRAAEATQRSWYEHGPSPLSVATTGRWRSPSRQRCAHHTVIDTVLARVGFPPRDACSAATPSLIKNASFPLALCRSSRHRADKIMSFSSRLRKLATLTPWFADMRPSPGPSRWYLILVPDWPRKRVVRRMRTRNVAAVFPP